MRVRVKYDDLNSPFMYRARELGYDRMEIMFGKLNDGYTTRQLKVMARFLDIPASRYNFMKKTDMCIAIKECLNSNGLTPIAHHNMCEKLNLRAPIIGFTDLIESPPFSEHHKRDEDPLWLDKLRWTLENPPTPSGDPLHPSPVQPKPTPDDPMPRPHRPYEEPEVIDATPEPEKPEEEELPVTPAPTTGLEGALFTLIESAMGDRIEESLTKRGLTSDGVEAVIAKFIAKIEVPRVIVNDDGERPEMVHPSFEDMMKILSIGCIPYLYGPAGSGKTHGAQQFAKLVTRELTIIPCNENMEVTDLIGYRDMRGEFVETAFYKAFIGGHVIVLDEADKAPGPVLVALNSPIQQRVMMFPNGTSEAHSDVVFIFTGNTRMSGASATYSAGQKQDSSFTNRMEFINWDYDLKLERNLVLAACKAYNGDNDVTAEWLRYVRAVRKQIKKFSLSYIAGPRQAISGTKMLAIGISKEVAADRTMFGWMRDEDAKRIKEAVS